MGGVTTEITELAGMRQPGCSTEVAARMAANEETLFYDLLTMLHRCVVPDLPDDQSPAHLHELSTVYLYNVSRSMGQLW
jgi:hypothetical protein